MYGIQGTACIACGDPVGPEEEWDEVTELFLLMCDKHDLRAVFYEIDSGHAHHYLDNGFYLLKLGEEAKVAVQGFSLQGGKNSELRHACTRAEKNGFTFEVYSKEHVHEILPRLKVISDTWLKEKNTKEKGFSLGFFDEDYLKNFSIAVIKKDRNIVAFANIWTTDQKKEYSIDLMRFIKDEAPKGVMDFLFSQMIFWGRDQGYEYFDIGMAPLAGLSESKDRALWNKIGDFLFKHGEYFYNFEGLRDYKDKYSPVWGSKYLACKNPLAIPKTLTDIAALGAGGFKGIFLK